MLPTERDALLEIARYWEKLGGHTAGDGDRTSETYHHCCEGLRRLVEELILRECAHPKEGK